MRKVKEEIETPTIGEILTAEYLEPNGITSYRLAKEIGVSTTTVLDIINGRRRLTVDTALRLSKFFGTSERFWLNLQNDIDIRDQKGKLEAKLKKIRTIVQQE
jgi:addiction module HigA family antidote